MTLRYLAIDPGQKRVGLAVSDAGQTMAFPLVVLEAGTGLISKIVEIVRTEKIGAILVGLPLNMDGSEGPRARASREFADKLKRVTSVSVTLFDERLSSAEADWKLAGAELTRDAKKKRQDAVAAAVFLQTFLDLRTESFPKPRIVQMPTALQTAQKAVEYYRNGVRDSIEKRGICYCALSGGSGPRLFFELLAVESSLDWGRIHLFWADERCVGPDHPDSNYLLAQRLLLSRIPLPQDHIHRIHGELSPVEAAEQYENQIRQVMRLGPEQWPVFDVVMLGLGVDGHTASLLPGTEVVENNEDITTAVFSQTVPHARVTLTVPALTSSRALLFLVTGHSKQEIVKEVLCPPLRSWQYPVHALWPAVEKMTWFVDNEAAGLIQSDN